MQKASLRSSACEPSQASRRSRRANRRSLRLPHGTGAVEPGPPMDIYMPAIGLPDLRDLGAAMQRSRALLDLDSDPQSVAEGSEQSSRCWSVGAQGAGTASAGTVDSHELAVRARARAAGLAAGSFDAGSPSRLPATVRSSSARSARCHTSSLGAGAGRHGPGQVGDAHYAPSRSARAGTALASKSS